MGARTRSPVLFAAVLLLALSAPLPGAATRPAAEQEKIEYLLAQIRGSDAVFIRNGKEYDGPAAAAHVKSKLWWAGKRVQTARDFILGVASRSEESGKQYKIRLKGRPAQPLKDWLLARLAERERLPPAAKPSPQK